jgi:hypothetical protein
MDSEVLLKVQQQVSRILVPYIKSLHLFRGVPANFKPWECGLSPSALYNCSLACRKAMGFKAPEVKWMSIKRWVTTTPSGIVLPTGVYYSIKRKESFTPKPLPHFDKIEYVVIMFPYGNVWSQKSLNNPITEEWLMSEVGGKLILEKLVMRDAAHPVIGYFESCRKFMIENPGQIGIHLKRKRKALSNGLPSPK